MHTYQNKLKRIVDQLIKKSSSAEIVWMTDEEANEFSYEMTSGTAYIKPDRDNDGKIAVRLTILDDTGDLKLTFDNTSLDYTGDNGKVVSHYPYMKTLLDIARRAATGEEQAVNDLLGELDGLDDKAPS